MCRRDGVVCGTGNGIRQGWRRVCEGWAKGNGGGGEKAKFGAFSLTCHEKCPAIMTTCKWFQNPPSLPALPPSLPALSLPALPPSLCVWAASGSTVCLGGVEEGFSYSCLVLLPPCSVSVYCLSEGDLGMCACKCHNRAFHTKDKCRPTHTVLRQTHTVLQVV